MTSTFEEKQKFNQIWLWYILIFITLIPIWGIFKQLYLGEAFGSKPLSDLGLIIFLLAMVGVLYFFFKMELSTKINQESIHIKFFPFVNREILWEDVVAATVLNYGFVGGWGIRLGTKYGAVYNTSGNYGLAIRMKDGKKLCIGTQKKKELESFIKKHRSRVQ